MVRRLQRVEGGMFDSEHRLRSPVTRRWCPVSGLVGRQWVGKWTRFWNRSKCHGRRFDSGCSCEVSGTPRSRRRTVVGVGAVVRMVR